MFSSSVAANEWSFEPHVNVSEQYTDNAFSTSSDAKSDFVTSVDVGFNFTGKTLRSDLQVSYNIAQDYYAHNHQLDGYRQRFLGIGNFELIDRRFFIDSRITFTEETLSQTGNTTATDRTQADGRTQVFNGRISPYYVHDFSGYMTGIARYSYSETIFSEPNAGASTDTPENRRAREYQLNLNSGRRFTNFKWALANNLISSESDIGDKFLHISSIGNGEIPLNRYFSAIGTVGYDNFDADDIEDDEISGLFGGAGIRFHPNSRTDASIQFGHRFGDPVFDLDASYAPTSVDIITASYRVSVQTADQSLLNTDLLDSQGQLIRPNFNVTDYVDDVSKSKSFTVRWNRNKGRNTYNVSGSLIGREFLSNDAEDQVVNFNASFKRQLTPRADLSFRGGYTDVLGGQADTDEDTTYSFGASYIYTFGNNLRATVGYDLLNRDGRNNNDLLENAVKISLKKTF